MSYLTNSSEIKSDLSSFLSLIWSRIILAKALFCLYDRNIRSTYANIKIFWNLS